MLTNGKFTFQELNLLFISNFRFSVYDNLAV